MSFCDIINTAFNKAEEESALITLGIKPSRPDTGYGYIQFDNKKANKKEKVRRVKTFTEKPNLELAQQFLESGDFLWNSGIFIWSAKAITLGLRKHLRDLYDRFEDGNDYYNKDQSYDNSSYGIESTLSKLK